MSAPHIILTVNLGNCEYHDGTYRYTLPPDNNIYLDINTGYVCSLTEFACSLEMRNTGGCVIILKNEQTGQELKTTVKNECVTTAKEFIGLVQTEMNKPEVRQFAGTGNNPPFIFTYPTAGEEAYHVRVATNLPQDTNISLTFNNRLAVKLGCGQHSFTRDEYVYIAPFRPNIQYGNQTISIVCDIIQQRLFDQTIAPILDTICLKTDAISNMREEQPYVYSSRMKSYAGHNHFHHINQSVIRSINFQLINEYGENIEFASLAECIILTLVVHQNIFI